MPSALFWQLGLTFMFIPSLIYLVVDLYRSCRDRERFSWRRSAVECALIPLFPLSVITWSIGTAVRTLGGWATEGFIENITKELKLIEIIGERQCCIKTSVMFSDMFYYQYFIHSVFTGESLPQAVLRWGNGNYHQLTDKISSNISAPSSSRTTEDPSITSQTPSVVCWASGTFSSGSCFTTRVQLVISIFQTDNEQVWVRCPQIRMVIVLCCSCYADCIIQ